MFIKLEPGGHFTPWTPDRIRRVDGPGGIAPVSRDEDRPTRTPAQVADRYQRMARRDEDPAHVEPARMVRQIMTSPVTTLPPDAHLDEAWRLVTARRFRHIPIVDADDGVVGMLSDRDLLAAAAHVGQGADRSISEIMATTVLACRPETSIRTAAEAMLSERIGAMPVVSKLGALVGIISRTDIVRAVVHDAPLELWI